MTEEIPEIRIALFGPSGSGKTTLLASYFGNQQRNGFEEAHGYRLEAEDASDGNQLLARYYRMEGGEFPLGTENFSEHAFGLKVHQLPTPSLRIVWYDYPGGWWERTPADDAEKLERKAAITKLLSSHVGVLLIDGQRLVQDGAEYVCHTLDQFKNEARKIVDQLAAEGKPIEELPRQWVIAVSKADLLTEGATAEAVCKQVVSDAADQLAGVARVFNARGFGKQYLLLAAVSADGSRVVDAHSYLGLQLIAPVALLSVLDELAQKAGRGRPAGLAKAILERLAAFTDLIDKLDDFLPIKYQVLTKLLKALAVKEGLDKGANYFREKQAKAARSGKKIEAAVAAMKAELTSEAAQVAFFRNQ
tara:strand:+ start:12973 stop:14058 length:1086 start_codon:yes stop_codon:yes gene_type:complete